MLALERAALEVVHQKIMLAVARKDYMRVRTLAANAVEIQQRIRVLEAQDFGMRRA